MKKIIFLLSAIMLTACHSTYVDKNDYDPETYDYIPETEHEYLGQYSYSGITMAWKDFSDYQLTEKVRNKAVKKYGRNIMLRNVKLSDGRTPMIVATSVVAAGGAAMAIGFQDRTTVIKDGIEQEESSMTPLSGAGLGIMLASPVFMLFKRYKITADVYRDTGAYQPARLNLIEDDDFEKEAKKQRKITAEKKTQEEEQRRIEERIARHEVWVGMSKDNLIRSRGEPTRATVENDGLASDMASVSVRGAAAVSSTTKANRVQVYYYSDAEIYIKENVVIEIYDRK